MFINNRKNANIKAFEFKLNNYLLLDFTLYLTSCIP